MQNGLNDGAPRVIRNFVKQNGRRHVGADLDDSGCAVIKLSSTCASNYLGKQKIIPDPLLWEIKKFLHARFALVQKFLISQRRGQE